MRLQNFRKTHASVIVGDREGIPISWCGGSPEDSKKLVIDRYVPHTNAKGNSRTKKKMSKWHGKSELPIFVHHSCITQWNMQITNMMKQWPNHFHGKNITLGTSLWTWWFTRRISILNWPESVEKPLIKFCCQLVTKTYLNRATEKSIHILH